MRRIFVILAPIALSAFLLGCGKKDSPPPAPTQVPPEKEDVVYKIRGKTAVEFYNQFLFRVSGACADKNVRYYFSSSMGAPEFKKGGSGKNENLDLKVLLYPDQTYDAVFTQRDPLAKTKGAEGVSNGSRKTVLSGRWIVYQDRLLLGSLGTARGVIHEGGPGYILQTENKLLNEDLKDREILMLLVRANYVPIPAYNLCK
ncbi:MAG: hypothetical protein AB7G93_00855 [Bdellovibrionales bacterium]